MTFNSLVDYAVKQIWCTPDQDKQVIIQPALISSQYGTFNTVRVQWRDIALPIAGQSFFVYQIGQLNPSLMGLFDTMAQWISMDVACNQQNMVCDIYDAAGIQLPRFATWFMLTPDRNLILAIQQQPKIPITLGFQNIFFRVYTNAFFDSVRATVGNTANYIHVEGKQIVTTQDILNIQTNYQHYQTLPGVVYGFVNGFLVSSIDMISVSTGDVVEYVYDSSVYFSTSFLIGNLSTFTSTLDTMQKYLIHYSQTSDGTIDYQDDVDFFLISPLVNNRYNGIYYHRNNANAIRQVTHKDYSISVPYLVSLANIQNWSNFEGLSILMHVRKAGYNRPLGFENNRIEEMYKLSDANVVAAMTGLNSTVPNWRAEVLEASPYTEIMRSKLTDITEDMAESALGYNASSRILALTPTLINNGTQVIDLPAGLQNNITAYEYDTNGLLLGYYQQLIGSQYVINNTNCGLVEVITGLPTTAIDDVYGAMTQTVDPTLDYAMYTCRIINGVPTNIWTDVTSSGQYVIINNVLTWLIDPTVYFTLVRSNKNFLAYTITLTIEDGVLSFPLTQQMTRNNGTQTYVMQVPMGQLDLWLNKNALVYGIDYIYRFPNIVIINKQYLVNQATDPQVIGIRFTNLANADQSLLITGDRGFISDGVLSNNNRFDIRDDKVLRITVGGATKDRSTLVFSENDDTVRTNDPTNGKPYSVTDIVVPMRGVTDISTAVFRNQSIVIDNAVSDYLTIKIPDPDFTALSAIPQLYPLYSPFLSAIINDLMNNDFAEYNKLQQFYNDTDVVGFVAPYLKWLAFDPTQPNTASDPKYTVVQPHYLNTVVSLDIYSLKFIHRVNYLYMNGLVNLSNFVNLSS